MHDDVPKIYCFDTNAFIAFNRVNSYGMLPDNLWTSLDDLFTAGRIISHTMVFSEICPKTTKPDFLAQWLKSKEQYFFQVTERQTQLVEQILVKFPKLIDPARENDEADPWLVSLAIEKRESSELIKTYSNLTIVSDENPRSSNKIPAVCEEFKVPHMNLKGFFIDNGWKFMLDKRSL